MDDYKKEAKQLVKEFFELPIVKQFFELKKTIENDKEIVSLKKEIAYYHDDFKKTHNIESKNKFVELNKQLDKNPYIENYKILKEEINDFVSPIYDLFKF